MRGFAFTSGGSFWTSGTRVKIKLAIFKKGKRVEEYPEIQFVFYPVLYNKER